MTAVGAKSLEETRLFERLLALCDGRLPLPGNLRDLCGEAAARLKLFPALHGQYTLHDEVHCLRVVHLMGSLIGDQLEELNAPEIFLLILAAYCHDQGMIAEPDDIAAIQVSEDWKLHAADWAREHANKGEMLLRLGDPLLAPDQRDRVSRAVSELETAAFTDYIRKDHGQRSAEWIRRMWQDDPRLVINGRNVTDLLATVCHSHVLPPSDLLDVDRFPLDELVGTQRVNVGFVTMVLRLADILDFDRERTPDSLYRAINFTSPVSLSEWEKHRSIVGWEITKARISFAAQCAHPAYERAVRTFLGWVEDELRAASEWSRRLPAKLAHYELGLPIGVDQSAVSPRPDPATGEPSYVYVDLEFSLARDELVHLLMTSELYQTRGLFARELLQNALDALRHRRALFEMDGLTPPSLGVQLTHTQDAAGFDVVTCTDDGVGMDLDTVVGFLTRAGRSYYRSPRFEKERARFRARGCDFDPCARFGIGFMSCFTFGDDITIRTKRDYGQGKDYGEPLVIEVTGLSGIVLVQRGPKDQPVGTTVEVRGRRKSITVDTWSDPVWLCRVVEGYALATEFPITAETDVPAIRGDLTVPTDYAPRSHPLEGAEIAGRRTFVVDLAKIDPQLRGEFRLCVLADASGHVEVATPEASIEVVEGRGGGRVDRAVLLTDGTRIALGHTQEPIQVCADGILIAGPPGREDGDRMLGSWSVPFFFGGVTGLIDTRGDAKPPLTPARTPPRDHVFARGSWGRLETRAGRAYGELIKDALLASDPEAAPARVWQVVAAYNLNTYHLPLDAVFRHVRFPVTKAAQTGVSWMLLNELGEGRIVFSQSSSDDAPEGELVLGGGWEFAMPAELAEFYPGNSENPIGRMEQFFITCSLVSVGDDEELILRPCPPLNNDESLLDYRVGDWPSAARLARFDHSCERLVAAYSDYPIWNAVSPVVARVADAYERRDTDLSPLDEFLRTLLHAWPSAARVGPKTPGEWVRRSQWKLGRLHGAVDWSLVPEQLRPPYQAHVARSGIDEIGDGVLQEWCRAAL